MAHRTSPSPEPLTLAHRRAGARWRAALLTTGACCLLTGMACSLFVLTERNRMLANQGAMLTVTARIMAERLDAGLATWARDVVLLSRFEAFEQSPPQPSQMRRLLEDLKLRSPEFSWIGFAGIDGRVLAATGSLLEGVDVTARPWFPGGLRGAYLGDVHPAVLLARLLPAEEGGENAYFVDAAAPVKDQYGTTLGVIAGHLNWRWAEAVRQDVLRQSIDALQPELLVISSTGQVLLGPDALRSAPLVAPDMLRDWTAAREGTWRGDLPTLPDSLLGYARTTGTPSHSGLGWTVVARQEQAALLASLMRFYRMLLLASLAISVAAGLIAARLTGNFRNGLRALIDSPTALPDSTRNPELAEVAATLQRLREAAYRDPLTGLLNRAGLQAWRQAHPAAERACAVLALDLDGFKPINDSHGHAAGDAVLQAIGDWLINHIRGSDAVARTGGDEFIIVLQGPAERTKTAAHEVAARLDALLRGGLETRFGRLSLSCSIGTAAVPGEAEDITAGLEYADAALYAAKQRAPLRRVASG